MFFENEHLAFRVIDVLRIENRKVQRDNRNRHFCALSFRDCSDAIIRFEGKSLQTQAGSVTFFPADVDYYREATIDEMIVFHLEIFNYSFREIETFVTEQPEAISHLFHASYEEWTKNKPDRSYRVTAILYQIFAELFTEYAKRTNGYSPLVTQALEYIASSFAVSSLKVSDIARQVGVCEVYLRRLFQREVHVTPKQYMTNMRLNYAASLLGSGYFTVSEAALRSGFSDEKYFSVIFKRIKGCSPSKYAYSFSEPQDSYLLKS